jgi:hypothetical protein
MQSRRRKLPALFLVWLKSRAPHNIRGIEKPNKKDSITHSSKNGIIFPVTTKDRARGEKPHLEFVEG